MKERPILFSGSMVRAILEGRKTQTRRVLQVQDQQLTLVNDGGVLRKVAVGFGEGARWLPFKYGQPGDRLWVRETHRLFDKVWTPDAMETAVQYRADMRARILSGRYVGADEASGNWSPSIFMRRWMSRITLEIAAVRVERLQDISEADAKAEGVTPFPADPEGDYWTDGKHATAYHHLWNEINGWDAAGSWDANPWVWVLEFKRVDAANKTS